MSRPSSVGLRLSGSVRRARFGGLFVYRVFLSFIGRSDRAQASVRRLGGVVSQPLQGGKLSLERRVLSRGATILVLETTGALL